MFRSKIEVVGQNGRKFELYQCVLCEKTQTDSKEVQVTPFTSVTYFYSATYRSMRITSYK